ncbi:MAG: HlyD family efflux transporter periplasmic adaptor subunit [Victivallales bacterium]|nr:HlyD family efflux transporter periplasmic adaptor subunit [Victivallales bacterium]
MRKNLLVIAAGILSAIFGCEQDDGTVQGYLEADMAYIAPISSGRINEICVKRGDQVRKGQLLFRQDETEYAAAAAAAKAQLQKSRSDLLDMEKGARPEEIDALKAKIGRLEAVCRLAQLENVRTEKLFRRDAIAAKEYDTTRLTLERDRQELAVAKADLAVAMLPARPDRIKMAQDTITAAENDLAAAVWRLAQRQSYSPAAAVVFDVLLRTGEVATPTTAVVALIPYDRFKVRFFVTPDRAATIRIGDRITVLLDRRGKSCPAAVSYVSPRPEYTPPVIYSRENNAKLTFMIEGSIDPAAAAALHPGLPVRVRLASEAQP